MNTAQTEQRGNYTALNYCLAFIDLLGQREAVRDQGLLPVLKNKDDEQVFRSVIRNSIGAIVRLQHDAEIMLKAAIDPRPDSRLRAKLSEADRATWDEMGATRLTTQRWSDGLVSFVSLGDREIRCVMNGVFGIFGLAGSLCLIGLASKRPIRGAIDVAWGVELHPGELYGPAVARAYEMESEVAQYPRIVVGPRAVRFLETHKANTAQDHFSRLNHDLAELCLSMLVQDSDGYFILHYLGDEFRWAITQEQHEFLYKKALEYVIQQAEQHRKTGNSKLAFRYVHLLGYFEAHSPVGGAHETQQSVVADQPPAAGG